MSKSSGVILSLLQFRFADGLDILLMIVGTICMIAVGVALPLNLVFFGDLITQFIAYEKYHQIEELAHAGLNTSTPCSFNRQEMTTP